MLFCSQQVVSEEQPGPKPTPPPQEPDQPRPGWEEIIEKGYPQPPQPEK